VVAQRTKVIGLTGGFGSGCTTAAQHLRDSRGSKIVRLSDEIRAEWKARKGNQEPSRHDLQRLGDEIREQEGAGALVDRAISAGRLPTDSPLVVVDGIRNLGEVKRLRSGFGYDFTLMGILSTQEARWTRIGIDQYTERGLTQSDFVEDDFRDQNEETDYGQQVELCIDEADILVDNTGKVPLETFIEKTLDLADLATGAKSRYATKDEIFMYTAYSSRFSSKCLKRNVGAVIVDDRGDVVGVGYNENPLGTAPCVEEPRYGNRCFRDLVRNAHFQQLSSQGARCPACGEPLPVIEGPPWRCPSCLAIGRKTNLEEFFFPDRAMWWCTAIHAEDRAILSAGDRARNSTLYTTTFPCFQCAEKIANVGIRDVCFTEAYPDIKSADRLEIANIGYRQFEGVRSSAFERIFSERLPR
jgi:deoxycytidylate deaminase